MWYKLLLTVTVITFLSIAIGCGSSEEHDTMHKDESTDKTESGIVRDYNVDVASIDENGDGNVFQCPMDWEVISDEPGNCPLCNMALKEYSVVDAQQNLTENKPHEY